MANQPGSSLPGRFRPGQALSAEDLNRIAGMISQRIVGGKGIRVRSFGGRLVLEISPSPSRKASEGTITKVGIVTAGSGEGPYTVDVYDNGIDQDATEEIEAYPLSGEDIAADSAVVLVYVKAADDGDGVWYFEDPTGTEGSSVKAGIISSGSGVGPYVVPIYDNGLDQVSTGVVAGYPMQIAAGQSFPAGLKVMVFHVPNANAGAGVWYFQGPIFVSG